MKGPGAMSPAEQDIAINALLDGEPGAAETQALRAAAAQDEALAQALSAARRLRDTLEGLQVEAAPPSLRHKLRQIGREQPDRPAGRGGTIPWRRPRSRWLAPAVSAAFAGVSLVALVVLVVLVGRTPSDAPAAPGPKVPPMAASGLPADSVRLAQARQDLAVAFSYLDRVGLATGQQIQQILHRQVAEPVRDNLQEHLPYPPRSDKEDHA